jgi:hypothetical protein
MPKAKLKYIDGQWVPVGNDPPPMKTVHVLPENPAGLMQVSDVKIEDDVVTIEYVAYGEAAAGATRLLPLEEITHVVDLPDQKEMIERIAKTLPKKKPLNDDERLKELTETSHLPEASGAPPKKKRRSKKDLPPARCGLCRHIKYHGVNEAKLESGQCLSYPTAWRCSQTPRPANTSAA